jgi:glycosyltransferase involved in cell wall biosynthesis
MALISDIVNQLQEEGVNAKVVQIKRDPSHTVAPPMGELRTGVITFESPKEAIDHFGSRVFNEGVIVAATNEMQQLAGLIAINNSKLTNVLFSQSYDPMLTPSAELQKIMTDQYHTAPHIISNAKWLDDLIKSTTKRSTLGYVSPGVNTDLFYPRGRDKGDDRPTVAFFLNSHDAYRGFERGLEAAFTLHGLSLKQGIDVRIIGIGVDAVQGASFITCVGGMSQARMASFLATEVDVVCDPQHVHTYGMPSLEAMASGAVPVCWDNIGIHEFAQNGVNSVILPKEAPPTMVAQEILNLLSNPELLSKMKAEAVKVPKIHNRKLAVDKFIQTLEKSLRLRQPKRKIFIVTPHLRKHGGPTTILRTAETLQSLGHDVTIGTIYADINPEIIKNTKIPISIKWQDPGKYDVLITNSDNPYNEQFSFAKWADKKIMLKLSHNPRFQKLEDDALKLEWDAICTSSDWLANVCANADTGAGWTYPPRDARRVGWYHYGHKDFACKYTDRRYFINGQMNIVTLIHHHPLKGTPEALKALAAIKEKFGDRVNIFGVGEWPEFQKHCPEWMQYHHNLDRPSMAQLFRQMDFFLGASQSEGLGRMALEAMSSSCLVIKTPTGAEYEKDMVNCVVAKGFEAADLLEALDRLGSNEETFKSIVKEGFLTAEKLADPGPYREAWAQVIDDVYQN